MEELRYLAEGFRYPGPGGLDLLRTGLDHLPAGPVKNAFAGFVNKVGALSLGEWEELHTRTLDLNPLATPYVGFQTWGESYPRGNFMAGLSHEFRRYNLDLEGELPDHLLPVLRYLAVALQPMPELVEILLPAIQRMRKVLEGAEPGNPYVYLFEAVEQACQ